MNWEQLEKKLINAARKSPSEDKVPYAFEKRVMARLSSSPAPDDWAWWSRALWLGAGACTAVALMAGVWSIAPHHDSDAATSFSHGVEQTLFASAEDSEIAW